MNPRIIYRIFSLSNDNISLRLRTVQDEYIKLVINEISYSRTTREEAQVAGPKYFINPPTPYTTFTYYTV